MDLVLTAAQATKRHNYTQMLISGVIRQLQGRIFVFMLILLWI